MKSKLGRGKGALGLLNYIFQVGKGVGGGCPTVLASNLSSNTLREMSREFRGVFLLRPDVERPLLHVSLSLVPGEKLDDDTWQCLIGRYLEKMDFPPDTPFTSGLHHDTKCEHPHLAISRISLSGKVWLGRWEARRSIEVCQELEREFGLRLTPGLHGDDDTDAKAKRPDRATDSQAIINANRVKGSSRIDTAETARVLLDCAARSGDLPSFTSAAAAIGIKVLPNKSETTGRISGLSIIPKGRKKAVPLGEATKNKLTWPKLLKLFEQNDQAAEAARIAAAAKVAEADERAAKRAADQIARQPEPEQLPPARALSSVAITQAKEAAMQDSHDDKLNFLNPAAPLPRPADVPLALDDDEDDDVRRRRLEREEADRELEAELRKLSVAELLDLRSSKVDDLYITAALLQKLVNLMLRILSLGLVNRSDTLSNALAARRQIGERAEAELARRRRSPESASGRLAALAGHQAALQERDQRLAGRHESRRLASLDLGETERAKQARQARLKQLEAGFDRLQASRGLDTVTKRRADRDAVQAELRAAQDDVPVGFGLLMLPARRQVIAEANAARAKRLASAMKQAKAMQAALQEFMDQILAELHREQDAATEKRAAAIRNEQIERDALLRELRDLPGQLLSAKAEVNRERVGAAAIGIVTDADKSPTMTHIDEEERARLRRLAAKGG